ncbi:chloride channel protein [Flammeovirga kamogawensis]|uniref:Chloride channel protein n=1 Tax=Flammeovirga kamogawensis TaxID=373891 RepID=A0ABX8GSM1_9BACT|nr:chloride channel protein [Flammeovirga kamogawensis]MBB6461504.1 CIC family chloride channel protein [Flammeovirga kamogawensis]QWG06396.1 chloride channel protein [Flammeovirga kamogawensis]TRX68225.1 chloride channel protein [Flammeovirga kamogawensis]
MAKHKIVEKLFNLRRLHLSDRNFILIVSSMVGIASGLAAVLLKLSVHHIHEHLTHYNFVENWGLLLFPIIGLLITTVIAKSLYKESSVGHAITDILHDIFKNNSNIAKGKIYSRFVTSMFTVGFGGSVGLESPIVLTGGAIGSNIAQSFLLDYKTKTLMIGCGTAGVISAIFNAPITGLIFSIEVILTGVSVANFVPLLISSVSAAIVSSLIVGEEVLFSFKILEDFQPQNIPFFIILGVLAGFMSIYFNQTLHQMEHLMEEKIPNRYRRALYGGIVLSIFIFVFPPIYGEGYESIKALLNGEELQLLNRAELFETIIPNTKAWLFLAYIIMVLFAKVIAASLTLSAGGSGGTFGPALVIGGLTGFAFARFINLLGIADLHETHFILVGMSGVLCGVVYAPLTAIFLIAEITGGYTLFVPLMLVSAIAYTTVSVVDPDAPHVRALKARGDYLKGDRDMQVLDRLNINKLIETNFVTVPLKGYLSDLVSAISISQRSVFPVVDDEGKLKGVITLDQVREIMFDQEQQAKVKIANVMNEPPSIVYYGERMPTVMQKFEKEDAWNLPVVDENKKYVGMVSKSRIFSVYRKQLQRLNKEWVGN